MWSWTWTSECYHHWFEISKYCMEKSISSLYYCKLLPSIWCCFLFELHLIQHSFWRIASDCYPKPINPCLIIEYSLIRSRTNENRNCIRKGTVFHGRPKMESAAPLNYLRPGLYFVPPNQPHSRRIAQASGNI